VGKFFHGVDRLYRQLVWHIRLSFDCNQTHGFILSLKFSYQLRSMAMTLKSILCIFSGSQSELNAVNAALILGKTYNAYVRFLHISPDPGAYAAMYGCGDAYAYAALNEACGKDNKERLDKAKRYVASLTAKHHVPLDSTDLPVHHASARFVHMTGHPDSIVGEEGRLSDLIVIGHGVPEADRLHNSTVIAALFDTGRPVMLLPAQEAKAPGEYKTIALAWKGTMDAGRAIYNAMPFLEKAEKAYVLTVQEHGETYDLGVEAALLAYLHTHGIHAQGIVVAAGTHNPAEALLIRTKELKIDLLVMGAYGHSRFREMLMGGVTNYMLETADIPLLLSH
jgi:nucleotide-binding universal stress UspA family protein